MWYPPDTYEEYMMAALAGNGCTECLMTTHTADQCPELDPEVQIRWAIDDEIDLTGYGTMVVFPTYEEREISTYRSDSGSSDLPRRSRAEDEDA